MRTMFRAVLSRNAWNCLLSQARARKHTFKIESAAVEGKRVRVKWSDGSTCSYPFVWMRDNCQCSQCFHPVSLSRTVDLKDLDLNVKPTSIVNDDSLNVKWSDGHDSSFHPDWLRDRSFSSEHHKYSKKSAEARLRLLWGSELLKGLPTARFGSLLVSDSALLDWLCDLHAYGLVRITDAPKQKGAIRQLVQRISFIRRTHYGEEFLVAAKGDPSNVAYTSGPLQLHTDLPYYIYKPGVELLHYLRQHDSSGGESIYVDGFHAAKELKTTNPSAYHLLSTLDVNWIDVGTEDGLSFHKTSRLPVICLNQEGEVSRINFSQPQRDSRLNVPLDLVENWYGALKAYFNVLSHPDNVMTFKVDEGDIISFDNLRILHGRTGFSGASERLLEGVYVDWDEIYSRIRVIENKSI